MSLRAELDIDVYRLREENGETDLVARVFGPAVDADSVTTAAAVLGTLAETRFPAECCLADTPVLPIGDGARILLTEFVESTPPPRPGFVLAWCAALLGRLATRSADALPDGGGWHRLGATPPREIDEALRLGAAVGAPVAELTDALAEADDGDGLPTALIHADLTPPNAIPRGEDPPVIVDWIGVGRGPRVWPLAFLLYVAGPNSASRNLERYARSVSLDGEEIQRLQGIMPARPLALDLWSVAHGRMTPRQAVSRWHASRARINAIARALA